MSFAIDRKKIVCLAKKDAKVIHDPSMHCMVATLNVEFQQFPYGPSCHLEDPSETAGILEFKVNESRFIQAVPKNRGRRN